MAGGQERILRRRIGSIDATKKITRAMELIAASRIVKAQGRVQAAKPYSEKVTAVITNLAGGGAGVDHPLLTAPEQVDRVAYVVIAADRGLCGGYNNNVLRAVERAIEADKSQGRDYALVLSGKKAAGYFSFRGYEFEPEPAEILSRLLLAMRKPDYTLLFWKGQHRNMPLASEQ